MLKLILIGNIGQDARINEINGRNAINFSIASNRSSKDKEGVKHDQTTWINCALWGEANKNTKVADYLKAGTKVYVEGFPAVKTYKNKEGVTVANLELTVTNLELVGGKSDTASSAVQTNNTQQNSAVQGGNLQPENFPNDMSFSSGVDPF